jgi:phospholipid N-methyltransferase
MSTFAYLRNFAKDKNIGSVTPTSAFGVKRVLRAMDFDKARVIVEYGPGLGVFTRRLLERMYEDALLIAIETNGNFARALQAKIEDPRLQVVNDSAENVLTILETYGVTNADYIISGIPFSFFPVDLKDRILYNTKQALGEDGRFFVYQFLTVPSRRQTDIKQKLAEHMKIVRAQYELFNIPPLRIYEASSGIDGA